MKSYTLYYRASVEHPISLPQMRRNGLMLDMLRRRGLAAANINVGHDAALLASVAALAGVTGRAEDDWPLAVGPTGAFVGGVDALQRHLAGVPEQAPAPADVDGERATLEQQRRVAQAELEAAQRQQPRGPTNDDLEDSLHVLDMRLSVLGGQFHSPPPPRPASAGSSESGSDGSLHSSGGSLHHSALVGHDSGEGTASPPPVMGTVDVALEGLEWAVHKSYGWVSSMVSSPPPSTAVAPAPDDAETYPDFEVVQTNWYGRHQKRILRVTPDALLRVHPMTGQVRKRVPLSDITSVVVDRSGGSFRVVVASDSASSEAYQSLYVPQLVAALRRYAPPQLKFVDE